MNKSGSLNAYCISLNGTLLDALKVIDRNAEGFAVVLDENQRVFGTLTDGDVRRALLDGKSLQDPLKEFVCLNFSFVSPEDGRAFVLDLMQARRLRQIPILDSSRSLVGIHFLNHILGHVKRPNLAVIMAGGQGTRLYPLTKSIPKPMVNVAGRPILERLILHLVSYGIHRIYISVNYLSEVIKNHIGDGEKFGCRVEYLHEDEPLGTAGSLALLPTLPTEPMLVMNGDLVMTADLGAMLDFHERGGYHATIGIKAYSHQVPYGCVTMEDGCVVQIEEKPEIVQQVNAGVYVLSPSAVASIPRKFYPITDLFSSALREGRRIGAFDLDCDWIDVGQHDQLRQARGESQ
ncbi:MAG: nucleotidyltransferase family protein [Pontiellaceae bacterium]|nr:nucleotidyltransferase family protein [Pontiellaceae bacterium]